jgi:LPS O-antigen subunit length determinant protein (WzzB/FepE family)
MLSIEVDKLEGYVTMAIKHGSPVFAKDFLELIIQEVNNLSRTRDLNESKEALVYLYDQLDSVQQSDVQLAVTQLIETQLKKQMMANVKRNYILQPIDSPFIPELRSSPQRTKIVISWTLLGLILSIMFVIGRHYISKFFR